MEKKGQKEYSYSVVLTPAEEGGFVVTVPSLPCCITEGDTLEEALTNAKEAIELTLEGLMSRNEEIPFEYAPSVTSVVTVSGMQYA
jgi:antitoxin HicB